jgi:hypothetical protein
MVSLLSLETIMERYHSGKYDTWAMNQICKMRFMKEVMEYTSWIDEPVSDEIRIHCFINQLTELPRCPICGKLCSFDIKTHTTNETCGSIECRKQLQTLKKIGRPCNKKILEEFEKKVKSISDDQVITDEIIESLFYSNKRGLSKYLLDENLYPENLKSYLQNRFADSDSIWETLTRIHKKIEKKPKCSVCGKPVHFIGKPAKMFSEYCSITCSSRSEKNIQNKKATQLKHWGTENCYDSSIYQEKMMKEYGVRFHSQRKEIKEKIRTTKEKRK